MKTLILPLFFAVVIGVGAQSQTGKPEPIQPGQPVAQPGPPQEPPKPAESVLGEAAAKAVAGVEKTVNPIQDLFDITEEKHKASEKADKAAMESIKKIGKDDPCSKRIAKIAKETRDVFLAYAKEYSLYIDKWSALTQEAIQSLEEQLADAKKPREDFPAELQRINTQIKQAQDDLANLPDGNPTFADARQATLNLVDLLLKNKKTVEEAMSDNLKDEEARTAQKQLLQARLQEIDAMKKNREYREQAADAKYKLWGSEWAAKCLAWTSKVNRGN